MIAPISRILARYLAGALVAYGIFAPAEAAAIEPDMATALGAAMAALAEAAYAIAVKRGWTR